MGIRPTLAAAALASVLLAGCGDGTPKTAAPTSTPPTTTTPTSTPTSSPTPAPSRPPRPTYLTGIDASHHQGAIDWRKVARAGIDFAYLKATEGTTFTDPAFAEHRRAAEKAGVEVAGYHYFQLCSDGAAQAEHFLAVLGRGRSTIPPALDLELAGSCAQPPPAADLLAEVRAFLAVVDAATGRATLVYLYPDLEERFGLADDLADHPQWVRRLGDRPPKRAWAVWQHDDRGSVPGVAGEVDLNRMKESIATEGR